MADLSACERFRRVGASVVCVSACDAEERELGRECVTKCPEAFLVNEDGKSCVSSCTSGKFEAPEAGAPDVERRCLPADAECGLAEVFGTGSTVTTRCRRSCPRYVAAGRCVEACPEGMVA